jgi:hypothetical protein
MSKDANKEPSSNAPMSGLSKEQRVEAFLMNELHVNSTQVQRMVDGVPTIVTNSEAKLLRKIQLF